MKSEEWSFKFHSGALQYPTDYKILWVGGKKYLMGILRKRKQLLFNKACSASFC